MVPALKVTNSTMSKSFSLGSVLNIFHQSILFFHQRELTGGKTEIFRLFNHELGKMDVEQTGLRLT